MLRADDRGPRALAAAAIAAVTRPRRSAHVAVIAVRARRRSVIARCAASLLSGQRWARERGSTRPWGRGTLWRTCASVAAASPRSSVYRAPPSGGGSAGSNPAGGTTFYLH